MIGNPFQERFRRSGQVVSKKNGSFVSKLLTVEFGDYVSVFWLVRYG